MRKSHVLLATIALAALIGAAPSTEPPGGRYRMTPADGGAFLRLDTHTGAMSVCQRKDGAWSCEAIADQRRALETEIDRLATENRELQSAVKRLEELLALPDPDGKDRHARRGGPKIQLPSEEDVDRAMDYIQRMMRKFKDRMRDFGDSDRRSL
jgi:hypothetical protein